MFPVRLIYASTVSANCTPDDIQDILDVARPRNTNDDITGLLYFNTDYFLQCLEGRRGVVNRLYHKIIVDPRHTDVVLLNYEETSARIFADWSMAYVSSRQIDTETLLRYAETAVFDPYRLDSNTAYSLVLELAKSLNKSDLLSQSSHGMVEHWNGGMLGRNDL